MKKTLLLVTIATLTITANAQNIVFKTANEDNSIGENLPDTLVVTGSSDQVIMDFNCFISNTLDNSVSVKIKREIIDYVSGAEDQLCWGTCTLHTEEDQLVEKQALDFEANEIKYTGYDDVTDYPGLGGVFHYQPKGMTGTTILKYTLISVDGTNETTEDEIVIKFTAGTATSINDLQFGSVMLSKPYPNPASNLTRVKYNFERSIQAQLVVSNIIGSKVFVYPLNNTQGEVEIELSDLPNGLYFINIESNGYIITNQKLIKR